jgi:D-alanyl-D-alanine carboxypeptidase
MTDLACRRRWSIVAVALLATACSARADGATVATTIASTITSTSTSTSTSPSTTLVPATSTSTTTSSSTTSSTTSTSVSTSSTTSTTLEPLPPVSYDALAFAASDLVERNLGVSISVWRDGVPEWSFASGTRANGAPIDADTPFVIASVSKLVTALSIARLVEQGRIGLFDRVPWDDMGMAHDPAWNTTTVRQLLAHTSGMPVARATWLDDPGTCRVPLRLAMVAPPTESLGSWRYSNGNYCALGLLVEHLTGLDLDEAAYQLVFDPANVSGPYLSTDGFDDASAPYAKGTARLARLGGAGTWLASTDDIAAMLSAVTDADMVTLEWPGIIIDQYGWGHTGTVDGAVTCAWAMQEGRTVITAFVSGNRPNTGGKVCDRVVPALAADLGIWADKPIRNPV